MSQFKIKTGWSGSFSENYYESPGAGPSLPEPPIHTQPEYREEAYRRELENIRAELAALRAENERDKSFLQEILHLASRHFGELQC